MSPHIVPRSVSHGRPCGVPVSMPRRSRRTPSNQQALHDDVNPAELREVGVLSGGVGGAHLRWKEHGWRLCNHLHTQTLHMEGAQWPVKAAIDFSLHCHQRLFPQLKLVCGIRSLPVAQREADLLLLQATGRLPGLRVQATVQVHLRRLPICTARAHCGQTASRRMGTSPTFSHL